ncbi:hypothetical protein EHS25_000579 [Saitozyma podzolica]|uniref:Major facilitator superfamily (MFS) profile domain-containing protein n=1 Tax=Saitozyma podzolica TaxID=1890683 RepID=A0A427YWL0_9TREE|nr:hypothetical protein EHS25_000579 [Saitozyma podzolica]
MAGGVYQKFSEWVLLKNPKWTEEERQEKALVRRLDIFFCSYISLSAIVKYLDQNNISNAYVSGMQEELTLTGNQYNFFTTYFNIGYIICIPISSFLMNSIIRPSIWLPTLELFWGITTGCLAAAKNYQAVYGLRFVIGFCEGTAWPGTMILLLSWNTPSEIGKRLALYQSATSLGGIFSGALQSALYTNLNDVGGLSGWRWLFVINSIITVVVAGWGYIGCPDYPTRPNPLSKWLRPVDVETSIRRMGRQRRALPKGWNWGVIKSVVSRPQNWAIWVAYEVMGQASSGTGYFNLWLKSLKNANGSSRYTVSQLNTIPIASNCITIVSLIVFLSLSDRFQTQWPFLLIIATIGLVFSAVLARWDVPDAAKFASFLILNLCGCYANLFVAWIGTLIAHSAEERAFVISALVVTYYTLAAGVPLKVWPASLAPHYPIGWKYAVGMFAGAIPIILTVRYLDLRQRRIDDRLLDEETSSTPEGYATPVEETKSVDAATSDAAAGTLPRI